MLLTIQVLQNLIIGLKFYVTVLHFIQEVLSGQLYLACWVRNQNMDFDVVLKNIWQAF